MGRKKKEDKYRRELCFRVRLTNEEMDTLESLSEYTNMTKARVVRALILEGKNMLGIP